MLARSFVHLPLAFDRETTKHLHRFNVPVCESVIAGSEGQSNIWEL